jgi:hypothetical protein
MITSRLSRKAHVASFQAVLSMRIGNTSDEIKNKPVNL